ncbi:MAG: hypothetical protein COV72_06750 [Candidatus Omnitrophica bacterium CG11_big_fil_rev_8_21_14_0_20_42_13]|uniref:Radical SAM core domain-containing protein n=1 Tax=Candidatus Ghiorseimicrobium undicola TaxID=1974746 RepID=A0A2H0LWK9_9BACT|nr:MAG: hypothetical protein COV72_06750 [Candidatus Omnitrophica bacterium CG11_big_fil_rev_8_21_14_0_20_42_13]
MQPNKEFCSIIISPYCSNNCVFCRPQGTSNKISPYELSKLEQDISASIKEFRKKGYNRIEISGADPLEYGKLPELITTLNTNGYKWIRISTNGVKLSDINFTKTILKKKVDILRIALYGSTAPIHDSVTGAKGSFNQTIEGIKNIKKAAKHTKILLTSLLLKQNALNLNSIFDLMHNLGCDDLYFSPVFISNGDYSYYIPHKMQGHFLRKLIKHALKSKKKIRFRETPFCIIGYDNDFTNNKGKVAHLGSKFQPLTQHRTKVIDLPSYRKKIKINICKNCSVSYKCDGFLMNDILKYGSGNLKAVKN